MANLELPFGVKVLDNKALDAKYLNVGAVYTSVAEVNSVLTSGVRSIGLTVNIGTEEYWYKNGLLDTDLILKSTGGSGGIPEAPTGSGIGYVRRDSAWTDADSAYWKTTGTTTLLGDITIKGGTATFKSILISQTDVGFSGTLGGYIHMGGVVANPVFDIGIKNSSFGAKASTLLNFNVSDTTSITSLYTENVTGDSWVLLSPSNNTDLYKIEMLNSNISPQNSHITIGGDPLSSGNNGLSIYSDQLTIGHSKEMLFRSGIFGVTLRNLTSRGDISTTQSYRNFSVGADNSYVVEYSHYIDESVADKTLHYWGVKSLSDSKDLYFDSNEGLIYGDDYSADFVIRSLIDKGFADTTYQPIATGTPDGSKFLRDDNTWATPPSGGGGGGGSTLWTTTGAGTSAIKQVLPTVSPLTNQLILGNLAGNNITINTIELSQDAIIMIGNEAGANAIINDGFASILIGNDSGKGSEIEDFEIFIGDKVGLNAVVGRGNIGIGARALENATGGTPGSSGVGTTQFNLAIGGAHTGEGLQGDKNTFVGTEAGGHSGAAGNDRVIGNRNVGIGNWALRNATGDLNSAFGSYTGFTLSPNYLQGSGNTFLGFGTSWDTTNNIFDRVLVIGNSSGLVSTHGYKPIVSTGNIYLGSIDNVFIESQYAGTKRTFKFGVAGIEYDSDISASFTGLSLINKAYADSSLGGETLNLVGATDNAMMYRSGGSWVSTSTGLTYDGYQLSINYIAPNINADTPKTLNITADIATQGVQTTDPTWTGLNIDLNETGRTSTGDANFIDFNKNGSDIFTVNQNGAVRIHTSAASGGGFIAGLFSMNSNRIAFSSGPAIKAGVSSAITPVLVTSWHSYGNTGIGGVPGTISIITDGVEGLTVSANQDITIPNGTLSIGLLSGVDPTGNNGMMYYNSTNNKFRAFENGTWVDMLGGASQTPWASNIDGSTNYLYNITTIRDANENEVLGFTGVTGAKNYIELVNSHSGLSPFSPQLKAVGDDTAIGIKYETKGNNSSSYHGFVNNSVEQFRFSNYTFMMKEAGSIKSLDTDYLSLVNSGASLRVYNGSGLGTNFIGISELDISSGPNGIRFVSTKLGFFGATAVTQPSHITNPTGGATVDIEARAAINLLLEQFASLGLQAAS